MTVGINLLFLIPDKVGGTETYIRLLLKYLEKTDSQNSYVVYCNEENFNSINFSNKNFRKVKCRLRASRKILRIIYEQTVLPILAITNKTNLLFSPGYISPLMPGFKSVVTIHDLNWYFHPEEFSKLALLLFKFLVISSAKRADHIITDSENSRNDIIRVLGVAPSKITSIYPGIEMPDKNYSQEEIDKCINKYKIKNGFLLCASASYKFKNIPKLVAAFKNVSESHKELKLIITGLSGVGKQDILDTIKNNLLRDRIILAGWVTQEELAILYSKALIYIHPSLYEGFGFPVLEAMSYGCPVISSSSASLPELVGDAGFLVNAINERDIAFAIDKVLTDNSFRTSLIEKGKLQVMKFSWQKSAGEYLRIFREI